MRRQRFGKLAAAALVVGAALLAADLFTADGVFIDQNSDAGFAAGGRVLASGREELAALVGGGTRGCRIERPLR